MNNGITIDIDGTYVIPLSVSPQLKDGDPVFFKTHRVGTFHGDHSKPGGWYYTFMETKLLPPEFADKLRKMPTYRTGQLWE